MIFYSLIILWGRLNKYDELSVSKSNNSNQINISNQTNISNQNVLRKTLKNIKRPLPLGVSNTNNTNNNDNNFGTGDSEESTSAKKYPILVDESDITEVEVDILVMENIAITHGDVLLGDINDIKRNKKGQGYLPVPKPWPRSTIPYEIDPNLSNPERIIKAINHVNNVTNVQWIERYGETDYVLFTTGNLFCFSYVGKQSGEQKILLEDRCQPHHILHEMVHTMGFFHEQSREDRDEYIIIHWENIQKKFRSQFVKLPMHFMNHGDTSFDYSSIMLYAARAFAKDQNSITITKIDHTTKFGTTGKLSTVDIERINKMYTKEEN